MLGVGWLILLALLLFHGAASETGLLARRCHINSDRFSATATSRGEWLDIAYDITYSKGLCAKDNPNGVLSANINGCNKSLTAQEGIVTFDNVATVLFRLVSDKKGNQLFFSQLCWTPANCTVLCSSKVLGTVSTCVVDNVIAPLIIVLFWVLPFVVCCIALGVCYARLRILRRREMLALREQHRQEEIFHALRFQQSRRIKDGNAASLNSASNVNADACQEMTTQCAGEFPHRAGGGIDAAARSDGVVKDIGYQYELKPVEVGFLENIETVSEEQCMATFNNGETTYTNNEITASLAKNNPHVTEDAALQNAAGPSDYNTRETRGFGSEAVEAEARRALEVAEAEARDALEVAEAEARRALEVAEAEARDVHLRWQRRRPDVHLRWQRRSQGRALEVAEAETSVHVE
ncbi:kinetoplast DNA-associated protein, partial [Trypanosoma conorhini]